MNSPTDPSILYCNEKSSLTRIVLKFPLELDTSFFIPDKYSPTRSFERYLWYKIFCFPDRNLIASHHTHIIQWFEFEQFSHFHLFCIGGTTYSRSLFRIFRLCPPAFFWSIYSGISCVNHTNAKQRRQETNFV